MPPPPVVMILLPLKQSTAEWPKVPHALPCHVEPSDSVASSTTTRPYFAATASSGDMSTGCPKMWTGTTARIRRPVCRFTNSPALPDRYFRKVRIQRRRIQPQGIPGRIDEMRNGSGVANGVCGRDEGDRRHDHLVIRLHAFEQQRGMKRRGAVDDRDGVGGPRRGGDHLLEPVHIFAGGRHPVAVDAVENEFPLARAQPRLMERHRPGSGPENRIDGVEHGTQIERGAAVGCCGGAAHHIYRL